MQTHITTEPISRTPIRLPAKLEYDLGRDDFVAWWEFLACKAPRRLPERVAHELIGASTLLPASVAIAILILAFCSGACRFPDSNNHTAVALLIVAACFFVFALFLAKERPGLYLCGFLGKLCRGRCLLHLRSLARTEAQKGRTDLLDVLSHYHFSMSPEKFTYTVEYQQKLGGSIDTLRKRHEEIAWRAVEVCGNTEQHVFFVIPDFLPVIVPRTCFADDASFYEFAQAAKRYHEARGGFISHEPQLNLPRSQAVTPDQPDRFGPRSI